MARVMSMYSVYQLISSPSLNYVSMFALISMCNCYLDLNERYDLVIASYHVLGITYHTNLVEGMLIFYCFISYTRFYVNQFNYNSASVLLCGYCY